MRVQVPLSTYSRDEWPSGLWHWSWKPTYFFESIVGSNPTSFTLFCFSMLEKKLNIVINFLEFKYRFIYLLISVFNTFLVCFYYKVELFYLIAKSFLLIEKGFIYTNLLDPIIIYIKLSFLACLLIGLPVYLYIFGFFFFKSMYNFYIFFWFFFFLSIYFLICLIYYLLFNLLLNVILQFLLEFQRIDSFSVFSLTLEATINQYFYLFVNILIIYIIIILLPVIFLVLSILNVFSEDFILSFKFRKYLYLILFSIFLIIMPPDFMLQLILFPIIFLILEIYIYLIVFFFILYSSLV